MCKLSIQDGRKIFKMAAKIKKNKKIGSEDVHEFKLIPCKLPIVLHTFCMAHSVQTINSRWPPNIQNGFQN